MQAGTCWLAAAASPTEPSGGHQGLSSGESLSPTSTAGWVLGATCSGSARDVVDLRPSRDRAPAQEENACQPRRSHWLNRVKPCSWTWPVNWPSHLHDMMHVILPQVQHSLTLPWSEPGMPMPVALWQPCPLGSTAFSLCATYPDCLLLARLSSSATNIQQPA